ncbi:hypothetical protein GGP93_002931 [Salinibacter ruber]|nr:hypothetical protein [Salinibacter ruber]
MVGGQGGWVLNRRFVLGGALRGIAPRPDVNLRNRSPSDPESAQVRLGYMGLLLEYIGAPSSLFHYGAEVVVGGGNVELVGDQGFQPGPSVSDESFERSAVFAAELGARAELNVTSFFRIGLSGGYRLVSGADLEKGAVSGGDLSAPYGQLSLRFGSFQGEVTVSGPSNAVPSQRMKSPRSTKTQTSNRSRSLLVGDCPLGGQSVAQAD